MSHLTRGAWIETGRRVRGDDFTGGRTSHEVRGLKQAREMMRFILARRTSHEVRGLKPEKTVPHTSGLPSHLTRGAWIETCMLIKK